jgi:hypothetical protein
MDWTKPGAMKELAGKIHGARKVGPVGQAVAIVEVRMVKSGKTVYVAAANASAPLTKEQRQLLKSLGIEIAPRARGVKEVAHAEPHIEAWVARRGGKERVQVNRWGISAGAKGDYICAACRVIAKRLGGTVEEFYTLGKRE